MSTLLVVSPLHRLAAPVQYHLGNHSLIITRDSSTPDAFELAAPSPNEEADGETIIIEHDEVHYLYQCLHDLLFMPACEAGQADARQLLAQAEQRKGVPLPATDLQEERAPVAGTHTFRKAVIETESRDDLRLGILCGQDCFVDLHSENASITSNHLAALFIETMKSDEPEPFNVGFLVGFVDALLRARKTYPRG